MGAPRSYRTEAIVLRRTNLGEADKILTLLTPAHGKIRAVAKAVRRPSAKLSGHLELFCRTELQISRGRELDVVTGAQVVDGYADIRDNLWRTSCAIYLLELVDRFVVEEQENAGLYDLLTNTLAALAHQPNPEMAVHFFELAALDITGFRPELRQCIACQTDIQPVPNFFGPSGVTCPDCPRTPESFLISVEALKVLRYLQSTDLTNALRLRIAPVLVREVSNHLRRTIRSILERDLKSTQFMDLVRQAS